MPSLQWAIAMQNSGNGLLDPLATGKSKEHCNAPEVESAVQKETYCDRSKTDGCEYGREYYMNPSNNRTENSDGKFERRQKSNDDKDLIIHHRNKPKPRMSR
jgi:hypothetical protein